MANGSLINTRESKRAMSLFRAGAMGFIIASAACGKEDAQTSDSGGGRATVQSGSELRSSAGKAGSASGADLAALATELPAGASEITEVTPFPIDRLKEKTVDIRMSPQIDTENLSLSASVEPHREAAVWAEQVAFITRDWNLTQEQTDLFNAVYQRMRASFLPKGKELLERALGDNVKRIEAQGGMIVVSMASKLALNELEAEFTQELGAFLNEDQLDKVMNTVGTFNPQMDAMYDIIDQSGLNEIERAQALAHVSNYTTGWRGLYQDYFNEVESELTSILGVEKLTMQDVVDYYQGDPQYVPQERTKEVQANETKLLQQLSKEVSVILPPEQMEAWKKSLRLEKSGK